MQDKFDLDSESGEITLVNAITGVNGGEYVLSVQVTDG